MTIKEKSERILPLFEKLTSLTRSKLPVEERDSRLEKAGILPRGTLFSCFHEKHLQEATELFKILFGNSLFLYSGIAVSQLFLSIVILFGHQPNMSFIPKDILFSFLVV